MRTPVLLVLVDRLDVFLQLVLQREALATLVTGQRLNPISRVKPREMSVEVERRGEGLTADFAAVIRGPVAEHVLLQRASILE